MAQILPLRREQAEQVKVKADSPSLITPVILSKIRSGGLYGLGESYEKGEFECDDLEALISQLINRSELSSARWSAKMYRLFFSAILKNTQRGSKAFEVADEHYNLGNSLFKIMLDASMSYTSGLFESEEASLAEAQEAKLRRICQKLRLHPGMRVLDVGCGWGNFALFAARHFGVTVVGLTVSSEQKAYIDANKAALPIEIVLKDYSHFKTDILFDRIVSIEMIEAVGKKNLNSFFELLADFLLPNGRLVLQAICGDTFNRFSSPPLNQFILWLMHNIFPNGYIPNLDELVRPARSKFVLESCVELAGSYEKTLRAWTENFNAGFEQIAHEFSPQFRRRWNYYLAGCSAMFAARLVQVFHLTYIKR